MLQETQDTGLADPACLPLETVFWSDRSALSVLFMITSTRTSLMPISAVFTPSDLKGFWFDLCVKITH